LKIVRSDCRDVADRSIQDNANDTDRFGVGRHDLPHERLREIAATVDDQDVTRATEIERAMDRQIVAWSCAYCHGSSGHCARSMIRRKSYATRHARHAVAQ
jgi:hypothetical protein